MTYSNTSRSQMMKQLRNDNMLLQYLTMNPSKTQCLLLRNKRTTVSMIYSLNLSGEVLKVEREGDMKYLDVTFQ
jgi:hypothetical protein